MGSQINGQFYASFDPDHEGHPGRTDDWVATQIYNNGVANLLSNSPADVILFHIGTNALNPSPADVEDILGRD